MCHGARVGETAAFNRSYSIPFRDETGEADTRAKCETLTNFDMKSQMSIIIV